MAPASSEASCAWLRHDTKNNDIGRNLYRIWDFPQRFFAIMPILFHEGRTAVNAISQPYGVRPPVVQMLIF
jgi:hypothetical protein